MTNGNSTMTPPQLVNALKQYGVTLPNNAEAHPQAFYDYQLYPVAGQQNFTFFQTLAGSGGNPLSRNNMPGAGQFPNPQNFLWLGTYISFIPGSSAVSFIPAPVTAAGTAAAGKSPADDAAAVLLGPASFFFKINTKEYLRSAPLASLPRPWNVSAAMAVAATLTAPASISAILPLETGDMARASGQMITSNMQFSGNVAFDSLVPTPSTNIGLLGAVITGIWYQLAQ